MVFQHHRPLTTMYSDNYRYGTSLYTPGVNDIEKNYRSALSKTHLRSDRGDLGLYTFAGSNLHGGTPAAEKVTAPRVKGSTTHDLYAPLGDTPSYGQHFYDHLRAVSPVPRKRPTRSANLYDEPEFSVTRPSRSAALYDDPEFSVTRPSRVSYNTVPARYSDLDSDLKKTTKTTTTTETWVPLTTHIYHTPFHTYYYKATPYSSYTYRYGDDMYNYNYLDDYKRYSTTSTKTTSKNVDALDLNMTSKFDYSSYVDK